MSEIYADIENLIHIFTKVTKRVLQNRPLSADPNKITEYIRDLCTAYNAIIALSNERLTWSIEKQTIFLNHVIKCKAKLHKSFERLKCELTVPEDFSPINASDIIKGEQSENISTNIKRSTSVPNINVASTFLHIVETGDDNSSSTPELSTKVEDEFSYTLENTSAQSSESDLTFITSTMATLQQKKELISMCANIIRENYGGNPLSLDSFIDKINLVESLSDASLMPILVTFILSKLEGKARECVSSNVTSVSEIKDALRNRIKPENSKVVASRIASCKIRNNDFAEFSKNMEELSDAFERSLIVEGMTQTKAHEMAIEQTVSTCRINASSDIVKSVLAASTFNSPRDVLAKLIIEENTNIAEKRVMNFTTTPKYNNTSHKPNRYESPQQYNNYSNQYNRNWHTGRNNFQNKRFNNRNNTHANRGNRNDRNTSYRNNNNRNNFSQYNSYENEANVRTLNEVSHQRSMEEPEQA